MTVRVMQLIVPTAIYGAERWILALASQLDKDRIHCELAVSDEGQSAVEAMIQLFGKHGPTHRILSAGSYDPRVISKLAKVLRERRIDIIHTHGYKSDLIGLAAARLVGIKAVSTPHGFGSDIDRKLSAFIRIGAYFLRCFDRVVPLSRQLLREVHGYGVSQKRTLLIENATDLAEIEKVRLGTPAQNQAQSTNRLRIGYVGQLIERKRVTHVLDAFDRLAATRNDIELVIAGEGASRSALEAHTAKLDSAALITFTGFVSERLQLMASLDIFVLGSASEGIPRCLMEAMALGLPSVAYNIEGVDELITDRKTGRIVDSGNLIAFTLAIQELLDDSTLREQYGKAAMDTIHDRFSANRMAQEYADLFEELIATP